MTAQLLELPRPPTDKDELWELVRVMWGVRLPRERVCDGHVAPFDAFSEAYFGNLANWVLWYGSRGTGKSLMLAILALTKAATMDINVTLLGGSMAQSQNVHEHVENLMLAPFAPRHAVVKQVKTELKFTLGNWIRPLPASQRTVRGPHPQMTLLDEIDEMEKDVYDAAMGQAMRKPNARGYEVDEMVVASSTWQNPIGTFQEVRDEALRNGMPVRTWCWREVVKPHGWMEPEFIERKRLSVPAEMFRVEYDMGEPAGDARAFDLAALQATFVDMETISERHTGSDDLWVFEEPKATATYAAGADWAKEKDKTVIVVVRTDVKPKRCVYLRRVNRRPWPEMYGMFNEAVSTYTAASAHDGTGIGNVVADHIDERSIKVQMVGRDRTRLLNEYIAAVERLEYQFPRNTPMWDQHRAATVDDIYGSATYSTHLPDDVAAGALMHRACDRVAPPVGGVGVKKTQEVPAWLRPIQAPPSLEPDLMGEVVRKQSDDDIGVFWLS